MIFRKVSWYFRTTVDSKDLGIRRIYVEISDIVVKIVLNNQKIEYKFMKDGCKVQYDDRQHVIERKFYLNYALDDLNLVMKNQNIRADEFVITFGVPSEIILPCDVVVFCRRYADSVKAFFKPLESLNIKRLKISGFDMEVVCDILSHFKEGTLKHIKLDLLEDSQCAEDVLISMPQWKMATRFSMTYHNKLMIPIKYLVHFSRFYVCLANEFTVVDAIKIHDILLKTVNFEKGLHYVNAGTIEYMASEYNYTIKIKNHFIEIKRD